MKKLRTIKRHKQAEKITYIKKHICLILISTSLLSFSQENIAPSVITGCGGSLQGYSMISVKSDFTLGEIAIETNFSEDFMLTQGFHQPSMGIVSLKEDSYSKISIYPNPTVDILNLELNNFQDESVIVKVIDLSGKQIYSETVFTNIDKHQINTSFLNLGSYLLEIIGKNQKDIFKIQKLK